MRYSLGGATVLCHVKCKYALRLESKFFVHALALVAGFQISRNAKAVSLIKTGL